MLTAIIVTGIIFIICVIGTFVLLAFDETDTCIGTISFGFIAAIVLVFQICTYINKQKVIDKHIADIVSIKREGEVEGSFCLGCGYVSTTQYYFYYYEAEPNKYKLDKVPTDKSYIIEDNSKTPSIYELKAKGESHSHYDIYVPVGTIITTFVLN